MMKTEAWPLLSGAHSLERQNRQLEHHEVSTVTEDSVTANQRAAFLCVTQRWLLRSEASGWASISNGAWGRATWRRRYPAIVMASLRLWNSSLPLCCYVSKPPNQSRLIHLIYSLGLFFYLISSLKKLRVIVITNIQCNRIKMVHGAIR
jgi:hypothetical protein